MGIGILHQSRKGSGHSKIKKERIRNIAIFKNLLFCLEKANCFILGYELVNSVWQFLSESQNQRKLTIESTKARKDTRQATHNREDEQQQYQQNSLYTGTDKCHHRDQNFIRIMWGPGLTCQN